MNLKDELARKVREGQAAARKLERLNQLPDLEEMPDGTVLGLTVGFLRGSKPYSYIGYRAGGSWFFTGQGPNRATSGEVAEWMARSGRRVLDLRVLGLYRAEEVDLSALLLASLQDRSGFRVPRASDICQLDECGCSGRAHP